MTLRFLLDAARKQKRSLIAVFVDYGKAFDSLDRRAIKVVLRHYGVPDPVVVDVMQLYHGSSCIMFPFLSWFQLDHGSVVSWFQSSSLDPVYRNVRYYQWCSAKGYTISLSC